MKTAFSIGFVVSLVEAVAPKVVRVVPSGPHPANHTDHLPIRLLTLTCVHEHLWLILIYFMHLLLRCALRDQKSLREVNFGIWECLKFFPYKLMVL